MLIGTSLVIACGCVINNYIDRDIDALMTRTRKRAMVTKVIPAPAAIIYGIVLGLLGFAILIAYTNWLTVFVGALGLFFYLVMYSIFKRRSSFGTVVGSVSGAMPLVAGYTAVTDHLDSGAYILFFIMTFWQMPHFYAIAMYRFKDYKAAGLPVLPVKKSMHAAKVQILAYVAAFTVANGLLTLFGYTGFIYLIVMVGLGTIWYWRGLNGFTASDNVKWGRGMFLFSLNVLLVLSIMLAVGSILP